MVKLLHIVLYHNTGDEKLPIRLCHATDLTSFSYFYRKAISDHINFVTRTVIQRTGPGVRQSVELSEFKDARVLVHVYVREDGLAAAAVSDVDYNVRIAFSVLAQVMMAYEKENAKWGAVESDGSDEPEWLVSELAKWQNPAEADKMAKIQKNLDEIKDIMHKNIDEVLKRGETIEVLMKQSLDLSEVSKQFYKKAKKTNQCCKMY